MQRSGSGIRNPQSRKAQRARREALEAHDRACDRLIAIAVKRREAASLGVGRERVDGWTDAGLAKNGEHRG